MKRDLLVTLADRNFIDQAKQLFSSVYWNAGWQGDYMLLAHGIPEEELRWFREKGILIKRCEALSKETKVGDQYPPTLLSKFHLFTPSFKTWNHVVYLDGDIIVRSSLDHLLTIIGFGARFYHVPLLGLFSDLERNMEVFERLRKDFDLKQDAFNAGVFSFQ